mgnify:CR=1 FL=1
MSGGEGPLAGLGLFRCLFRAFPGFSVFFNFNMHDPPFSIYSVYALYRIYLLSIYSLPAIYLLSIHSLSAIYLPSTRSFPAVELL